MASPLSSEAAGADFDPGLTFRTQRGAADVPTEWEPATIVLEGVPPEKWRAVRVKLNGRPLPVRLEAVGETESITADWERASSGTWIVEVSLGPSRWSRLLKVRPAKISGEAFAAMLDDLESGLPTSIAVGLDRLGAFTGLDWRPPRPPTLAQEVEHVRRALQGDRGRPGLVTTLHEVARDPHGVLAPIRPWVPAERARRPSPADLPAAFAKPGNLTEGLRPLKVADCRVEHSFDVYENRLLRVFRDQAGMRLRRVMRWLTNSPAAPQESKDAMSRLSDDFSAACRAASFLDGVGPLRSAPETLTMVLLRKPPYRAALEGYLAFRRSAAAHVSHPALDAPLENVPFLYETWGTLTLVAALLDAAAEEGLRVTSQRLHSWAYGEPAVLLPPDNPAVTLEGDSGIFATLTPQRQYPRGSGGGFGSVSFTQVPDVTVEVRRGGHSSLFLFDPKYKLFGDAEGTGGDGRPKKEDIDKMHAYRDAIRGPGGGRPVKFAAILYPGADGWFGDDLAALSAVPGGDGFRRSAAALMKEILSGGRWEGTR